MDNFEKELMQAVERVVIKKIADGNWLGIPHSNAFDGRGEGLQVSRQFLANLYGRIDMNRIADLVLHRVEERIADKIFNTLATEVGNDTKALMCDGKARDAFRAAIKERISVVCHD